MHYKDLTVWQRSIDLIEDVYRITRKFPQDEIYTLTSQLRRAAISIPSNIAEGQGRASTGEFKHFLGIARGSAREVETQICIAERLGYVGKDDVSRVNDHVVQISKMLTGMIVSLERKMATS